ncbi:class I SAM-dependent methyltransferase [bacterium]|nr:MAG: class I SAM-dependent methyltransferase [bacterium]
MGNQNDELIRKHYKAEAEKHGTAPTSTLPDEVYRQKEIEVIRNFLLKAKNMLGKQHLKVVDIGCGNGYTLSVLAGEIPEHEFWGFEFTEELLAIAQDRKISNCRFQKADVRSLDSSGDYFDVVFTERCLINVLDWEEKKKALIEINRILLPGGYYLMLENFTDGLADINKARGEFGLGELKETYHNRYFEKTQFFEFIQRLFIEIKPEELNDDDSDFKFYNNYLSSYFFFSRFFHPLLSLAVHCEPAHNTEFVKFFSNMPPVGNYAAPQAHFLKKPM